MTRYFRRLYYLVLQELRGASRSRYIIISFVFMPLLMWGLQGGVQLLTQVAVTSGSQGETIFITNFDTENPMVDLNDPFTLPMDFDGSNKGDNVTEINLSAYLTERIKYATKNNNFSTLYGMKVNDSLTFQEVDALADKGEIKYWLHIRENFASNYNNTGITTDLQLRYLPGGLIGPALIQSGIFAILSEQPFTIVTVEKATVLTEVIQITLGGETAEEGIAFGAGLAGFIAIIIAVMAPAPFVSTSFAGEREKRTMEALLALPLSRKSILLGKLSAGMVLVGVFALMNIVGMYVFNFIMTEFSSGSIAGEDSGFSLFIDLNPATIIAITVAMFLSAFIAIGIGISIASLSKDVRTSESMYSFTLLIPSMIVGMLGLFGGVPESFGTLGLLLYIIPWSHTLAIFQKIIRPEFYNVKTIFGMGLWVDLLFHLISLFVIIGIILYIASKIFEREGIVN